MTTPNTDFPTAEISNPQSEIIRLSPAPAAFHFFADLPDLPRSGIIRGGTVRKPSSGTIQNGERSPASDSTFDCSATLSYTPLPLLAKPADIDETLADSKNLQIFDIKGKHNPISNSVRHIVMIRNMLHRSWHHCVLKTKRYPGISKVRSNLLPEVSVDTLTWNLGTIKRGDSIVVNTSIPRTLETEFLLRQTWPFEFSYVPMPHAELQVACQAPETVSASESYSIDVTLTNSELATADHVVVKGICITGRLTEIQTAPFALAAGEQKKVSLIVPFALQDANDYRLWLEADGAVHTIDIVSTRGTVKE